MRYGTTYHSLFGVLIVLFFLAAIVQMISLFVAVPLAILAIIIHRHRRNSHPR